MDKTYFVFYKDKLGEDWQVFETLSEAKEFVEGIREDGSGVSISIVEYNKAKVLYREERAIG